MILEYKLHQTSKGLTLAAKSPLFEKIISEYSDNQTQIVAFPDHSRREVYKFPKSTTKLENGFFNTGATLTYKSSVNLSFLLIKGLKNGITITFNEVHSPKFIDNIRDSIVKAVKELYELLARGYEVEVSIEL